VARRYDAMLPATTRGANADTEGENGLMPKPIRRECRSVHLLPLLRCRTERLICPTAQLERDANPPGQCD
jgi:hypothetical protein